VNTGRVLLTARARPVREHRQCVPCSFNSHVPSELPPVI